MMRAKMKLTSVTKYENSEHLTFTAVCANSYPADGSDENNTYAKFTPSAELKMSITNPVLLNTFSVGETFYVDFTKTDI